MPGAMGFPVGDESMKTSVRSEGGFPGSGWRILKSVKRMADFEPGSPTLPSSASGLQDGGCRSRPWVRFVQSRCKQP
jgi:hypothetical protein